LRRALPAAICVGIKDQIDGSYAVAQLSKLPFADMHSEEFGKSQERPLLCPFDQRRQDQVSWRVTARRSRFVLLWQKTTDRS
jgi:hypothetical protein